MWLFAILNYLYCDVVGLMDAGILRQFFEGTVGGMEISQSFLFFAAVLMEIPIAMIVLSSRLSYKSNRLANIVAGIVMTLVQMGTLLGTPTAYYIFFSVIEIGTTIYIVWLACTWQEKSFVSYAEN